MAMTYSFTQISHYLRCPRLYRYRYLDGWREKENRANALFGRCFEKALAAIFLGQDSAAVWFTEWATYQQAQLEYTHGDTWDRMFRQGIQLLETLAKEDRLCIRQPRRNLQLKLTRKLGGGNNFVSYIDAIGQLDGTRCLIEWKTTTSRYPEEPTGLLALDPQLVCYSWISRIEEVALVAFVRKRMPEIQYLRATISEQQRQKFAQLVEETAARIEQSSFLPHSGIRFPQNGCTSCSCVGLCLGKPELVSIQLLRQPGASDLDWLDELTA